MRTLDGALFARMVSSGAANLKVHAKEINDLNVFPIPDGDTGDNMLMTMLGGICSDRNFERLCEAAEYIANGMLLSARGNSGVILSQFFEGMKNGFSGLYAANTAEIGEAFRHGVRQAYNDLATTDPKLLSEWDYEKNRNLMPTSFSRNSMQIVWWRCAAGHTWRAKISDRTIEGKDCAVCEKEFQSAFPQLLIMLYAKKNGLQVITDSDQIVGIELGSYIPELKLAIETEAQTVTEGRYQEVKEHICKCNGIKYVSIKHGSDLYKTADLIRNAFRKCHIFFAANDEEDVPALRNRFKRWRIGK